MGRFKIYDPVKLVSILSDPSYAKCLLCEKRLKNIMGNIKRHYEQIHSMYVNANADKTKKSRKKSTKRRYDDGDEDYKVNLKPKIDTRVQDDMPAKKSKTRDSKEANATVSSTNGSDFRNKDTPSCVPFTSELTELDNSDSEKKSFTQETAKDVSDPVTTSNQENEVNSSTSSPPKESERKDYNGETASKPQLETELVTSPKKLKLNEENSEIQIPCFSYINNINIHSLDSRHQVDFLKILVETKTQLNIPLTNFQKGHAFQEALQKWKQNYQFSYSSEVIGENLDRAVKKMRQEITKMTTNRIIHLKLDIATRQGSNAMLVNIQFINEFKIRVVTLSVVDLQGHDLASDLKEKVLSTLERYQINISRVFSITKDSTRNVREFLKRNENINQILVAQEEKIDKNICPQPVEYCPHLCEQFPGHTLHFVACDVIKELNKSISQSRNSARILRQQVSKLKANHTILLDNSSSWFSVYDMIKSLLDVREIVENSSTILVEVDWLFAEKFEASFRPIVDTAIILQTTNFLTMGDFYREWLLCEIVLEELSSTNELAVHLLVAMRKRKINFFENSSFLAAIYLDPRFCYMGSMYMNDKQKDIAIIQLLKIFNKLKEIHEFSTNNAPLTSSKNTSVNRNDRYSKLEKSTAGNDKHCMSIITSYDTLSLDKMDHQFVKEALVQLQFEERLPFNINILDYWKICKYKSPVLTKIAEIALAAPATQSTISRALDASSVALMKSKYVESSDVIENLLLLKLNQDLVEKIAF